MLQKQTLSVIHGSILLTIILVCCFSGIVHAEGSKSSSENEHTGIVIDARGLNVSRSFSPKILSETNTILYGYWDKLDESEIERMSDNGLVAYCNTVQEALHHKRAGTNPIFIKAQSNSGPGSWDIVLSSENSVTLLKACMGNDIMDNLDVVFLVDGKTRDLSTTPQSYTGIIVDACGLGLRRAASPRILDNDGVAIYGEWEELDDQTIDYMMSHNIVSYCESIDEALQHNRAGLDPIIIKADAAHGPGNWDLILSETESNKIRNIKNADDLFDNYRVIFLKDKGFNPYMTASAEKEIIKDSSDN